MASIRSVASAQVLDYAYCATLRPIDILDFGSEVEVYNSVFMLS